MYVTFYLTNVQVANIVPLRTGGFPLTKGAIWLDHNILLLKNTSKYKVYSYRVGTRSEQGSVFTQSLIIM
uniref:Uncharacterized protein n=1 Tax=Pararge aegeria TaxID=116150 RepID=S4P1A5_9NEOP